MLRPYHFVKPRILFSPRVASPANAGKILNVVLALATAHFPSVYMVNFYRWAATAYTRHKVANVEAKEIDIDLFVVYHRLQGFISILVYVLN